MKLRRLVSPFYLVFVVRLLAQKPEEGTVTGLVINKAADQPVEYAALALKKKSGGETIRTAATDSRGAFTLESVPFGEYTVAFGLVGTDVQLTQAFTVDAQHRSLDLGRLALADTAVKMDK